MARNLHSFTLTDRASDEVKAMKRRTKSAQVSIAIEKYANDYQLSPHGVKYWKRLRGIEEKLKNEAWQELQEYRSKQGVKHHLGGLLRCLSPFRLRKRVDQPKQ